MVVAMDADAAMARRAMVVLRVVVLRVVVLRVAAISARRRMVAVRPNATVARRAEADSIRLVFRRCARSWTP
jgi:hypothetical protein